jgi:outer membrane protein, multidrug efflux system
MRQARTRPRRVGRGPRWPDVQTRIARALIAGALFWGCNLAPRYERPKAPVPKAWPTGDAYEQGQASAIPPQLRYQDIFSDPELQNVIGQALRNGRDLRVAAANVASVRAQYRVARSGIFPSVNANAGAIFGGGSAAGGAATGGAGNGAVAGGAVGGVAAGGGSGNYRLYSVNLGSSAFELDLFGRLRNLSAAALDAYLASDAGARSARLALVSQVASTYLTLAADRSRLSIARETLENAGASAELASARLSGGVAALLDLRQAQTVVGQAQSAVAEQKTAVAQDLNLLVRLVGAPLDPALLPASLESVDERINELPAGLSSEVLLRRPDVVEAEYRLRSANARIGAARAAFFPSISLTGLVGFASPSLSALFSDDSFNWSVRPNASLTIFDAGANSGNLAFAWAQRELFLAQYEQTIQTAFREVADALARQGTLREQLAAQQLLVDAARDSYRLAEARYRGGVDSFLASLEAQRTLFSARQSLLAARLSRAQTLVALYRVLGGDAFSEQPLAER